VALWMRGELSKRKYCERDGISRSQLSKWWNWIREDRAREQYIKMARHRGRCLRPTRKVPDPTSCKLRDAPALYKASCTFWGT
jgi:transposase-like protein